MEQEPDRTGSRAQPGLERCISCGRPFVVAAALLDEVDDGLYLMALACRNCGVVTIGVHEDAELERLERATRAAQAQLRAALDVADSCGWNRTG